MQCRVAIAVALVSIACGGRAIDGGSAAVETGPDGSTGAGGGSGGSTSSYGGAAGGGASGGNPAGGAGGVTAGGAGGVTAGGATSGGASGATAGGAGGATSGGGGPSFDGGVAAGGLGGAGGLTGATGGTAGAPGSGGASTDGGTGGSAAGGATSTNPFGIHGSVTACPDATPPPPITFTSCADGALCTNAHCIPKALVPAGTDPALLAACPSGDACIPDDFIAVMGKFLPKTCTSLLGAEGRCLSTCLPMAAGRADWYPLDVCAPSERCVPCFDPVDGTDTGACRQGCDPGPHDPTVKTFARCGQSTTTGLDMGRCLPAQLVPGELSLVLPKDACTGADDLCEPVDKARDPSYEFPTCLSSAAGLPPDPSQPGGCVPEYFAAANAAGGLLTPNATFMQCLAGSICMPCVNPLDQTDTGACK